MNLQKTKIISPDNIKITIDGYILEIVQEYVYLGHKIKLGNDNQTAEISRRIQMSWAAFGNLAHVLRNQRIPINLKHKVYDSCILPITTYGMETMTITRSSANRLRICQRAIERAMLGISLRDRIRNKEKEKNKDKRRSRANREEQMEMGRTRS